jgi:hypothetical protein
MSVRPTELNTYTLALLTERNPYRITLDGLMILLESIMLIKLNCIYNIDLG